MREKNPPSWLQDYVAHTTLSPSPCDVSPSASPGTSSPLTHYISSYHFSTAHRLFLANVDAGTEPRTFAEAMRHEGWRAVMTNEIRALEANGTWDMASLPPGKKALGCKWVYKINIMQMGQWSGSKLV